MTSFVKNSRFVYVIGLARQAGSFVVDSCFHNWTLLFDAPARCPSVGWRWRAGRLIIFFKKSLISWEVYRLLWRCRKGPPHSDVLYIVLSAYGLNGVHHRVFMFLRLFFCWLILCIFVIERVRHSIQFSSISIMQTHYHLLPPITLYSLHVLYIRIIY